MTLAGKAKRGSHALRAMAAGLHPRFNFDKKYLIDFVFQDKSHPARSFADLGGVWGIEAAYTFYTLDNYAVDAAFLVDTRPTDTVIERARGYPPLSIQTANFGDPAIPAEIGHVDVVYLFDVLLHQVSPDWDEVLRRYAGITDCMVIFNQQWIGGDDTVRLLDLGKEEYLRNVPHELSHPTYESLFERPDEIHPVHQRPWRDIHGVWQWGITDSDLVAILNELGFEASLARSFGQFSTLRNFENHGFVFRRS